MSIFIPTFEFIGSCKAGDLVRVKVGDTSEWAILGARQSGFAQPLMILNATTGPKTVNLFSEGRIEGDFATIPALQYGSEFEIEPDHTGPIALLAGETLKIPGRILQSGSDLYLIGKREDGGLDYVHLGNYTVHSEPGGQRALYSKWRLTHKAILRDGKPRALLDFEAPKAVRSQKAA